MEKVSSTSTPKCRVKSNGLFIIHFSSKSLMKMLVKTGPKGYVEIAKGYSINSFSKILKLIL